MNKNQPTNFTESVTKGVEKLQTMFKGEEDIISVIEEDHKPLKELIAVMKDSKKTIAERTEAFSQFAPLLMTHAKAEEKSLYEFMKTHSDLREDAFEGDAEHVIADQLCEEIKRTTDVDQLGAKIKVLAEAVEHHIKEEENEILPEVRKSVSASTLKQLTQYYVKFQTEVIADGQDDSKSEKDLSPSDLKH